VAYVGQAAAGDNDQVFEWIKGLFFLGVKTAIGELCETEGKSIIQAVSMTQILAQRFVEKAPNLDDIGVRILQMGNFNINFDPEERKRLVEAQAEVAKAQRGVKVAKAEAEARQYGMDQQFQQDARYVQQLAGSYQGYAAGRAMIGAGEGMAEGGGNAGLAGTAAQMAVGMGMAGAMAQNMARPQGPQFPAPGMMPPQGQVAPVAAPPQAAAPTAAAGLTRCPKCGASVPLGRFCAECGGPLAVPQKRFCTACGAEVSGKFCANCGTPAA